jgi:hypothetical protein
VDFYILPSFSVASLQTIWSIFLLKNYFIALVALRSGVFTVRMAFTSGNRIIAAAYKRIAAQEPPSGERTSA